ncbi:MAG: hypothetical protein GJ677_02335 [Rhodobacteraceae bacterium]|nr:hypothetical protein [Paracoccaceae bacterium]
MISEQHRFIYLHAPKTGGNATQAALLPYSSDQKTIGTQQDGIERFGVVGDITPRKHATLADYAERLGPRLKTFHIAITLRHPFSRALSHYFTPRHWQGKTVHFDRDGFIESMRKMVPLVDFLRLGDDIILPQTLMRFDHLSEDFLKFCNRVGLPETNKPLRHLNRSVAAREMHMQILADSRLRKMADMIFADDIAFLERTPEGRDVLSRG